MTRTRINRIRTTTVPVRFHIFPTDAYYAEYHPRTHAYLRARKEREKRRGPIGKFFGLLAQILLGVVVFSFVHTAFSRGETFADGFGLLMTSPIGIMAVFILPYFLFLWRVERFFIRRFRQAKSNIKAWMQDDDIEQPEQPVTPASNLKFKGDPKRN